MQLDAEPLRRILAAGIQAPSAENKHDLRFQPVGDTVHLIASDSASWIDRPHRQMLALLSYGAVIENMTLRSVQLGHAMTVRLLPDASHPERVADLTWKPTTTSPDPLCLAIDARHTNRRLYRRAALAPAVLARLSAAAQPRPEARLLWLDDAPRRRLALQAILIAETERFRRRELHQELFSAVRFEHGWQQSCSEGLPPAALQVESPMRLPFALLRHWPAMRAATWFGMHHALGFRAGYLPCALAPHLGLVLAGAANDELACLYAGRAFQRLWLAAAAEGLALQPMAAATVLLRQTPGAGWVSAGVQDQLQQRLQALCSDTCRQPCLIFRLGQAAAPSAISGRRPVEHYIE